MNRSVCVMRSILVLAVTACISAGLYAFEIEGAYPRIITPNGDHHNDRLIVKFSNPFDNQIEAKVFSALGAEIAVLPMAASEDYFYWDGNDSQGRIAPPGAYLFQVRGEGSVYNGIVVVAR